MKPASASAPAIWPRIGMPSDEAVAIGRSAGADENDGGQPCAPPALRRPRQRAGERRSRCSECCSAARRSAARSRRCATTPTAMSSRTTSSDWQRHAEPDHPAGFVGPEVGVEAARPAASARRACARDDQASGGLNLLGDDSPTAIDDQRLRHDVDRNVAAGGGCLQSRGERFVWARRSCWAAAAARAGSMVSVFCVAWPATSMSLFAAVPSTTVRIVCAWCRAPCRRA